MKRSEVDRDKLSPMMRHYVELKDKYEDTIILYRLGDFYEMFFEDAEEVAHALELTLTGKNAGLDERVPMCGIPHHAAEVYIDKLIKKGYKVAICEQLEDPKTAKGIVKRDIVEVISSGTIINTNSLNEKENNYIGCLYDFSYGFVLTYSDITTGEIYSELLESNTDDVLYKLLSLDIKELIVNELINKVLLSKIKNLKIPVTIQKDMLNNKYVDIYKNISDSRIINSIKLLLYYLDVEQKRNLSHFQEVIIKKKEQYLEMDIHTKRNLELTECLRTKEKTYSLLWLLDNTKTAMGSRKLKNFIENPLLDAQMINKRYDIVSKLLEEFILAEELRNDLYEVYDLERLCGKLSFGSANGKDLLQLKASLKVLPSIKEKLEKINFYEKITTMDDLYNLLEKSIYEEPPNTLKEGYLIKDGYSIELDELKDLSRGGKDFISRFETEEKERTGIKGLKVGFNKVFGYYIEISKSYLDMVTDDMGYIRKQTLANCERFINPILKEKEDLILSSEDKIINLEYDLFTKVRDKCKEYIPELQRTAKVISEIDVLGSFALISEKYNYVRPNIVSSNEIKILNSRHPVVEKVLKGEEYVPNDIVMDNNTDILLITGPNMAGKSTYMRQLGIIAIMAQIGCFVPASEATLPVFDKIFTRIGASDDLVSGESTFMVEMMEASRAIRYATRNSLILFDELGRGTATFDGMSLAQAILEYIANKIKCKTLFSTHYHELTDMEKTVSNLKNKHVSAIEEDGNITFLHKVKDGSVDKSYGINVAKLAGLPEEVIDRASGILKIYENKERKTDTIIQTTLPLNFEEKKSEVEEDVKNIDILNITPIEAINFLSKLKEKIK
ncbi:MAG: DNA mismatch repair protein MutS [Bacilli bacterium]|nr:DNA mismatch repair protein MutS [Bacilli bacterium]